MLQVFTVKGRAQLARSFGSECSIKIIIFPGISIKKQFREIEGVPEGVYSTFICIKVTSSYITFMQ